MRRPEVVVVALLVALAGAGCSRVAFMKTDTSRGKFEETNAPVVVHDTPEARNRTQSRNALGMSEDGLRRGDLVAAEKYARQALSIDPNSVGAYTLLAVIAEQQGQSAQAGQHYQRASQLAPNDGRTLNNYGTWLCKNGQAHASLDWFDRALQAPGYATPEAALANSGSCALDAGDTVRADRDLRQALALAPENPVALAGLARLQFRSGNYFEARAFSERRLAAAPADADALVLASQIEDKLGDSAAAARYVRRLREEFPGAASGNAGGSKSP
jgi:type IV pilus assembly protein PilF